MSLDRELQTKYECKHSITERAKISCKYNADVEHIPLQTVFDEDMYNSKHWALFYVLKLFYYKMHRLAYIHLRNFKATIDHLCILLTLVQDNFKIVLD